MLVEDFESWLDYISDHVFRPRFDKERVNGERERVLREISDDKSNPAFQAQMEFERVFYKGHPKSKYVLGREEVIKNADRNTIRSFHGRGYHPNNMDLIIAGGLPENAEELIKNYFGNVPSGQNTRREFPEAKLLAERIILHRPAPERVNSDNADESSAQIYLHFAGPINGHQDEYAVEAMNRIIAGDTNSLLFQNLELKKGLAYYTNAIHNGECNVGELGINAYVPAKRIDEAVDTIF